MIKVGIIDSGYRKTTTVDNSAANIKIAKCYDFTDHHCHDDLCGHGSAVSNIIATNPKTAIYTARVFHDKLVTNSNCVIAALQWLIAERVDIINMSFGLKNNNEQLATLCQQAIAQGIILVAASPAQGDKVYPASYHGVIRATGDARCQPNDISYLNSSQADLGAYAGDPRRGIAGASIGCAWVTVNIINQLTEPKNSLKLLATKNEILTYFQQHARFHGRENKSGRENKGVNTAQKQHQHDTSSAQHYPR